MLWRIFLAFLKVGLVGYGGGPGSIGLIQEASRGLVPSQSFAEMLAVGQALPGPIATKLAAGVGYQAGGLWGAIAAVVGVAVPSIVLFFLLYRLLVAYANAPAVAGALHAALPVVGAILLTLALDYIPWRHIALGPALVFAAAFVALRFLNVPMPYVILGGLVVGAVWRF